MIKLLPMPADFLVGIEVKGKIEQNDIVPLIDSIRPKFEQHEKIAVYVELAEWEGISLAALWEDLKFGLPHIKAVSKKAVVTENKWLTHAVEWADMLFPGVEARTFPLDEKQQALEWLMIQDEED
ncbi:SpoIIAA family protein [Endozoicomonas numazuensis]|uniref:STAS/SEC14 domain-containing protein n=1 Tax=Endozoicomonas numazuensis TaxID=1137799 RepID=A0A081NDI9_9GAMM|nr:STAS/SEC14 domain-containing protein [Endozoicomonas numazuensis]KEQ16512.1 hypothetical protein GZ78_21925 [Endozoicomonas numazuensis]